jgi:hypothetical protein
MKTHPYVTPPHRVPPYTTQPRKPHNQQKEEKGKVTNPIPFVNFIKGLLAKKDEGKNER